MNEKLKWILAAAGVVVVGVAVWEFLRETRTAARPVNHTREPW
jgi:hypothetical protein